MYVRLWYGCTSSVGRQGFAEQGEPPQADCTSSPLLPPGFDPPP